MKLPLRGAFVLILALILAGGVNFLAFTAIFAPHLPSHGKCAKWIGGPKPVVACEDGHSWQITSGAWVDLGRNTGPAQVPQG